MDLTIDIIKDGVNQCKDNILNNLQNDCFLHTFSNEKIYCDYSFEFNDIVIKFCNKTHRTDNCLLKFDTQNEINKLVSFIEETLIETKKAQEKLPTSYTLRKNTLDEIAHASVYLTEIGYEPITEIQSEKTEEKTITHNQNSTYVSKYGFFSNTHDTFCTGSNSKTKYTYQYIQAFKLKTGSNK